MSGQLVADLGVVRNTAKRWQRLGGWRPRPPGHRPCQIDPYRQPTLINARKRKIHPAVLERQQLADALARYMGQLGLKRRAKPTQSLGDLLAKGATT